MTETEEGTIGHVCNLAAKVDRSGYQPKSLLDEKQTRIAKRPQETAGGPSFRPCALL